MISNDTVARMVTDIYQVYMQNSATISFKLKQGQTLEEIRNQMMEWAHDSARRICSRVEKCEPVYFRDGSGVYLCGIYTFEQLIVISQNDELKP